jgi:thioredoxin reductase (NADPH)
MRYNGTKEWLGLPDFGKGCLVNSLYHYPVNMTFFLPPKIGNWRNSFCKNNAKPTRNEALEYYRRVAVSASLKIKLFEEELQKRNG